MWGKGNHQVVLLYIGVFSNLMVTFIMCIYIFLPFLPFHQSINTIVVVVHFLIAFRIYIQLKDIVYYSYRTMGLFKLKVYLLPTKNAIWVCEFWVEGD
jgi:hypothetical protein